MSATYVSITLIRDRKGDQVMHMTGCGDIKRSHRSSHPDEAPTIYEGATLAEAIRIADTDMAGWFCEKPYTKSSRNNGCWTTSTSEHAPCFEKALKTEGVRFDDGTGEPLVVVASRKYKAPAVPSGQCRGKWSRCGGTNPSKSATWRLCDDCTKARAEVMAG